MPHYTNAFTSYLVDDLAKASSFYTEMLGLNAKENKMGLLELEVPGGHQVIIYPKDDHQPATYTVFNFTTGNIDQAVEELSSKGLKFLHYEGQLRTDAKDIHRSNGQGPDIAWFKDPAGNILSIIGEMS